MLKKVKKFVSLVLVLALSFVICVPTFASNTDNKKDSEIKNSTEISYISKSDAILLANQCIKGQISNNCPWTKSTKISETVMLFDFEGNVNAYLFRLTTNGKHSGYVFVNAYSKEPSVEAFGYDCDFILDAMQKSDKNGRVTTNDHIIFGEKLTFLNHNNASGKYFMVGDKLTKIDANQSDLIKNYKSTLQSKIDANEQTNLASLKAGLLQNSVSTSAYPSHDLSGISEYEPYTTNYFGQFNNCAPTAATNLIYYWSHYGKPQQSKLWKGRVYDDLANYMHYDTLTGTPSDDILPGIQDFASSRNDPVNQAYDDGYDCSTLEDRINCDYPVIVTIENDPNYGGEGVGHSMLAVGYMETKRNCYIRVADGKQASFNNFYKFSDYVDGEYSVSW